MKRSAKYWQSPAAPPGRNTQGPGTGSKANFEKAKSR
jgi:hypothetical protein